MAKVIFAIFALMLPLSLTAGDQDFDTLTIKPIGVEYSKYSGTNKLYIVGRCDGMDGNQIVVFQNRPSFAYFEKDETFKTEQSELEKAIWAEILDKDADPIVVKGRWHQYNEHMVFLCHQIIKMNKLPISVQ